MVEVCTNELTDAIDAQVGGDATFFKSVRVTETFQGQIGWDGRLQCSISRTVRAAQDAPTCGTVICQTVTGVLCGAAYP
jgi:hypothetical protein